MRTQDRLKRHLPSQASSPPAYATSIRREFVQIAVKVLIYVHEIRKLQVFGLHTLTQPNNSRVKLLGKIYVLNVLTDIYVPETPPERAASSSSIAELTFSRYRLAVLRYQHVHWKRNSLLVNVP